MMERKHTGSPATGVVRFSQEGHWDRDVHRLLRYARSEAVVAVSNPAPSLDHLRLGQVVVDDLLSAGKQVRLLYSPDYLEIRDRSPLLRHSARGAQIRVTDNDFHNALIIDRRVAVLWSGAGADHPYAYLIREPALLRALHQFAVLSWQSGHGLGGLAAASHVEVDATARIELDATARAVLNTLNLGLIDEAAARRLGMSLRTYRRHIADLTTRLEVRSRFQIGVRAAQLGLLDDAPR
ncbi:hypothetical protein [Nocardia seriolae]|uniref:hypothetical protein n=1 Tax=Nocardia seriolae TaxID=37332 RepID=UPI00090BFCED|nr:hypothetical protein [Nocardia seriolae]QOW36032.1 hypothetical protein IMZ23_14725 [Nocardia seriolae]QUN16472.1 hypothetical protein KEC46_30220 [Nocardia seriolae]WKY49975.1 hypothetical protein Q5P07_23230 [Nocardia seriolae]WNJ56465.1 hypothetical protein RMO66_23520 [Nocardia seriolae]BAW06235.1 conserved hypothetical protein [Nocardia seriolae]